MKQIEILKQYLKDHHSVRVRGEGHPFVTISRQAGAGGHTLAREIVRRLDQHVSGSMAEGWEVFDQMLCALVAQDKQLAADYEALVTEQYHTEIRRTLSEIMHGKSDQYVTFKRIFELVRILLTVGKVVVVGRGGVCLARNMPWGINIRLVAGERVRVRRMAVMLEVSEDEALRKVHEQDKARVRMVDDFFNQDITNPLLYHAVFNTETMAVEDIADIVGEMVAQQVRRYNLKT